MTTTPEVSHDEMLKLAREDPGVFLSYVFDFPLADMHRAWLKGIMTSDRTLIVSPRAHAKTSIASIALPCWFIGRNPNVRVKLISGSDNRAKDIVFAIFKTIKLNARYREVFPATRLANARESKWQIWVERDQTHLRDATVEALGCLSTAEGSRADVLILDDVVTQRNAITPGMRNQVKEAYYNVHLNLLSPDVDARVIYIGTVWHRDDLTVELMYGDNDYDKQIYAIDEDFTPLWPQIWPTEKLVRRCNEITLRRFNIGFRNMPATQEDYYFSEQLFIQCQNMDYPLANLRTITQDKVKSGDWRLVMGVDLAGGNLKRDDDDTYAKQRKRAYNVIVTTAIDSHNVRIPVDIKRFKARSPETARILIDAYEDYKPEMILVESNNFGVIVDWIGEMVKLPIESYFTDKYNKRGETGVISMQTEMSSGMWKIPTWLHEPACKCEWCTWKSEVTSYPFGRFSDTVMAWWLSREAIRLHMTSSRGSFAVWEF